MLKTILLAAVLLGVIGLAVGVLLVTAGEKFRVNEDEREIAVRKELPGNNCGACGYPGCDGLAAAIVRGDAPANACPVGGAVVGAKIGAIMGVDAGAFVKKVAYVRCAGDCDMAITDRKYIGIPDCRAASVVPGNGAKRCLNGCLGYGSCVNECHFDAIHVRNGVAVVNPLNCVGCGKCASVCPNDLIMMIPAGMPYMVRCKSQDKGKTVRESCAAGCIGCTLCTRKCENDAIHMQGNVAQIDPDKCTGCGVCAEVCPAKVIRKR